MPIVNRIADFHAELTGWRRHIHQNPELGFEEFETADFVAARLTEMGIEIHRGLGGTGVVATIKGNGGDGPAIGLRADMDALPIQEKGTPKHRSKNDGKMHACGHDGHTTMLLGAAKYLSETRNFAGTVHLIFQPAEEGKGGGKKMIEDGLFKLFPVDEVYGMHNRPEMPVGCFGVSAGPVMAARDNWEIAIKGRGAHAAMPHQGIDPVVVGANIVMALQTITSRNTDPAEALVISATQFHAGDAFNVIPDEIILRGTCRVFNPEIQAGLPDQIRRVANGIAATYGATAELNYITGYPATVNTSKEADFAAGICAEVAGGTGKVDRDLPPSMGAEDFSYMLQEKPGAYIWCGNGDTAGLHHPEYDFNDEALTVGASYWSRLVETRLAKSA
ncbi:MAG: amidohydrolase [Nisaea sp.]|uniref:M20 aminoacylase family protein n=1 Tax=Nisaea sp. TaxID=2024842 RepID=UPI001B015D5F|nr:M20 aminoacylase family protein [Nisaea sp.]MBO6560656.1 amidohydrolase [Nisaea sp.]